jgi:Zn-dependent oligopeptidase
MIDLELHAAKGDAKGPGWSTRLHAHVVAPLQLIPQPDGSVSHSTFGHLGNYGANYYSYLWCRGISALVWRALFVDDPLREGAGDKLVNLFRELAADRKSEISNLKCRKPVL